ncbi:hypothetical protein VTK56DRAFT_1439 [Thermocarpiscus australiensis]
MVECFVAGYVRLLGYEGHRHVHASGKSRAAETNGNETVMRTSQSPNWTAQPNHDHPDRSSFSTVEGRYSMSLQMKGADEGYCMGTPTRTPYTGEARKTSTRSRTSTPFLPAQATRVQPYIRRTGAHKHHLPVRDLPVLRGRLPVANVQSCVLPHRSH